MPQHVPVAHAVGIDLGTTYSCLSYLNPQGQPVTLPNAEGEFCTPSVVLFDGDEVIVGTEALRNSVAHPDRVIENSKRFMGDPHKCWVIDGRTYRPHDIGALILKKLLEGAEQRLGPIRQAVITVPAQFSDLQRQATIMAGQLAGLEQVDIINEPVAAALCHVLSEGSWFAELANDQIVMVFDLGGGTFDLSLVKYNKDSVKVIASGGDLHLGGIDWNKALAGFACVEFAKVSREDPRLDRETMQALAIEVEQTKRSLSVRPRASITVNHAGKRKLFPIDQNHFETLTADLVQRCRDITLGLLKDRKIGWHEIHAVLVTGGASRMPMIRKMLKQISGTTLNDTLSPDQSISHGAAFYAGMRLTGNTFARSSLTAEATARLARVRQQSVNARGLGILVRDKATGTRFPHYLIPPHSALPAAFRQRFGTVVRDQRRVHLQIVESGTTAESPFVELGSCLVDNLPRDLPEATPIEVTIRYDEQARVHVEARELKSGTSARVTIVREENLQVQATEDVAPVVRNAPPVAPQPARQKVKSLPLPGTALGSPAVRKAGGPSSRPHTPAQAVPPPLPGVASRARKTTPMADLDDVVELVPLCDTCGEPLNRRGECLQCGGGVQRTVPASRPPATTPPAAPVGPAARQSTGTKRSPPVQTTGQVSQPGRPRAQSRTGSGGQGTSAPRRGTTAKGIPAEVRRPVRGTKVPAVPPIDDEEIIDLTIDPPPTEKLSQAEIEKIRRRQAASSKTPKSTAVPDDPVIQAGEEEFWNWHRET